MRGIDKYPVRSRLKYPPVIGGGNLRTCDFVGDQVISAAWYTSQENSLGIPPFFGSRKCVVKDANHRDILSGQNYY